MGLVVVALMWIEYSLRKAPIDYIKYENVLCLTYTAKYLKVILKDGTEIRIPEKNLEDTTWGTSKQRRSFT